MFWPAAEWEKYGYAYTVSQLVKVLRDLVQDMYPNLPAVRMFQHGVPNETAGSQNLSANFSVLKER
jgi:hypothetical protein